MIKNGIKERKLYFYHERVVNTEIQMYKCKKCGKKFKTDISDILNDNSNLHMNSKKSTMNKIAISSDLDDKYKPVIERSGFKHQWCLIHVFKNINKKFKTIYEITI